MFVRGGLVFSEGSWGEISERLVGALLVVAGHPFVDGLPHFGETAEEVGVEHFAAQAAIEALDVGVLGRLAGLDVMQDDAVGFAPRDQLGGDELGAELRAQ